MKLKLKINGSESENAEFVGWTPVKCTLTIDGFKGDTPMPVTITPEHYNKSGRIDLYLDNSTSATPVKKIEHDFQSENELIFFVAGKFNHASIAEKDTYILVKHNSDPNLELKKNIMVRVRKNANKLTDDEIKLFLRCFTELNTKSAKGKYEGSYTVTPTKLLDELVLMHSLDTSAEIHGRTSFHPWHRAFLLHLEREMQMVDARVTVPYWKYDESAHNVFTEKFVGRTPPSKLPPTASYVEWVYERCYPKFDQSNPMYTYKDHTSWGPLRRAYRYENPADEKPNPNIHDETTVLRYSDIFEEWCEFEEVRSHNRGHTAFTGHVVDVGRDPVDPLFFMMHGNVDRLWALWQNTYNRFDPTDMRAYPHQDKYSGSRGEDWANDNPDKYTASQGIWSPGQLDIGNFLEDTMWPWDLDNELSRPWRKWAWKPDYGEGNLPEIRIWFPNSVSATSPGQKPTVRSTIDYQGRYENGVFMGFDYDQIPYFDADQKPITHQPAISTVEYNATFLNPTLSVEERLFAGSMAIMFSENDIDKTFDVVANRDENKLIRLKAINLIDVRAQRFPRIALDIMSSEEEEVDLRSELIYKMLELKRANQRLYAANKPEFFNILRGLLNSKSIVLRTQAIDILSASEDQVVQEFLVGELQKDKNSSISKVVAISFLRQNTKNQFVKLFQKVFENESDNNVRKAAIEGLENDPGSIDLLKEVVMDTSESFNVREAGALSLHNLDHELMNNLAAQIISEPELGHGIKLFRSDSPEPNEVDFKAGLINMLTYTADPEQLRTNEELKSSLRELVAPGTLNKANFRSTIEVFSAAPLEDPTIIEQMAAELLGKL